MDVKNYIPSWKASALILPVFCYSALAFTATPAEPSALEFSFNPTVVQQTTVTGSKAKLIERNNILIAWDPDALSIYTKQNNQIRHLNSYSANALLNDDFARLTQVDLSADGAALLPASQGLTRRLFRLTSSGEAEMTDTVIPLQNLQFSSDGQTLMGNIFGKSDYQIYTINKDWTLSLHRGFALPYPLLPYSYEYNIQEDKLFIPSSAEGNPVLTALKASGSPSRWERLFNIYLEQYEPQVRYEAQSRLFFTLDENISCYKVPTTDEQSNNPDYAVNHCAWLGPSSGMEYIDSDKGQLLTRQGNNIFRYSLDPFDGLYEEFVFNNTRTEATLADSGFYLLSDAKLSFKPFTADQQPIQLMPNHDGLYWDGQKNGHFIDLGEGTLLNATDSAVYLYQLNKDKLLPKGRWVHQDFDNLEAEYSLQLRKTPQNQLIMWSGETVMLAEHQAGSTQPVVKYRNWLRNYDMTNEALHALATPQFFGSYLLVPGQTQLHVLKTEKDKLKAAGKIDIDNENTADWANPQFNAEVDGQLFHFNHRTHSLLRYQLSDDNISRNQVLQLDNTEQPVSLQSTKQLLFIQQGNKLSSYKVKGAEFDLLQQYQLGTGSFRIISEQLAAEFDATTGLKLYHLNQQTGELQLLAEAKELTAVSAVHRILNQLLFVSNHQSAQLSLYQYNLPPYRTTTEARLELNQGKQQSFPLSAYLQDDEQKAPLQYKLNSQSLSLELKDAALDYDGSETTAGSMTIAATDESGASNTLELTYSYNKAPVLASAPEPIKIHQGQLLSINIMSWFKDPEGDPFEFVFNPMKEVTLNPQGYLVGHPNESANISAEVVDHHGAKALYSFALQVNKLPVLRNANTVFQAEAGQSINIDLSQFFIDPEGSALSFAPVMLPTGLSSPAVFNGKIVGVFETTGTRNLIITVADAEGARAEFNLPIEVKARTVNPEQSSGGGAAGWAWLSVLLLLWRQRNNANQRVTAKH